MNNTDNIIRIGRINYTNAWPMYHYFPMDGLHGLVEFDSQVPTGLNKALAAGEIDMGPISSFSYGEHFDQYMMYPHLSVSAKNKVNSILLFHREPLELIKDGRFALPTTSATSVHLLKILLQKFYSGSPEYQYASPSLHDMIEGMDGALLIGDDAIKASWEDHGYLVTDLGEEWKKQTGLGMTFAVWAVRQDTIRRHPETIARIYRAFIHSKQASMEEPMSLIHEAMAAVGGTEQYWKYYFSQLTHDFGPEQAAGLELYYKYAWELGFLPRQVPLQIWSNDSL